MCQFREKQQSFMLFVSYITWYSGLRLLIALMQELQITEKQSIPNKIIYELEDRKILFAKSAGRKLFR